MATKLKQISESEKNLYKLKKGAMAEAEQMEGFRSNLNLVKSLAGEKAEEEFFHLMQKAKATFGDLHIYMGELYFQYAKFLIDKMERNLQIFNTKELPKVENPESRAINEDDYEDDDSSVERPQSENNVNQKKEEEKQEEGEQQGEDAPVITEDALKNQKQEGNQNAEEDDFDVCGSNLLCAIQIYEKEKQRIEDGGEPELLEMAEISRFLSRCKSRLGDLYYLNENHQAAVEIYLQVIKNEEQKIGHESNRGVAEIHYMIGNSYLQDNKDGCEQLAIKEYIDAVRILVNNLCMLGDNEGNQYEIPTFEKTKVNRFPYLPLQNQSDEIKQIKDILCCLLDKIEDTFQQISIRSQYKREIQKIKELNEGAVFKEVSESVKVVKLGTFGNRKKKEEIGKEDQNKGFVKNEGSKQDQQSQI